jgi:gentisate 1,2-dioxygenase
MSEETFHAKPNLSDERKAYYAKLAAKNSKPLWEVLSNLVTPTPRDKTQAAVWHYSDMRPLISEGAKLITPEEAERRVLILENPGLPATSQITQSLYAGLQMIGPGEIAPSHRHVASALRYVIEGEGAYTAVNGERAIMRPGDFILTPSWEFHDHGNQGSDEVVWLDGLDIPMANLFCTSFAQHHPQETQPVTKKDGAALNTFGMGMMPVEYRHESLSSPLFVYPFERSRTALTYLSDGGEPDPCSGYKLQYTNPVTGGSPMPTISSFLQALPAGFKGQGYRSTDATIYCVSEGRGRSFAGDVEMTWAAHDVFVIPSWHTVRHEAAEPSILFSFSDRAAQKALGIWREEFLGDVKKNPEPTQS